MANTSTVHIKTDFDCKVFDYGQELSTTKADTFCNFELRKGEHELTFVYTEDESISKTITYEVKDADCDYRLTIEIVEILCKHIKESIVSKEYYSKVYSLFSKQDFSKVVEWFTNATELGDKDAAFTLALYYEKSDEPYNALKWFRKAAELGHPLAHFNLGLYYENGNGVWIDYDKAIEWFTKAAKLGITNASYELAFCYSEKGDMDNALNWLKKAAEQGVADAQADLGRWYKHGGYGVEQDYAKAVEWYTKAVENGHPMSHLNLGFCYRWGDGVEQDLDKAIELYTKAAELGVKEAPYELALFYEEMDDIENALKWFTKAAEKGEKWAYYNLGSYYQKFGDKYENGKGCEKDHSQAIKWYFKSAECYEKAKIEDCLLDRKRECACYFIIGCCYENGDGVETNLTKAIEWYTKAAEQGYEEAKKRLEGINQSKKNSIYYLFFDTETTGLFVDEKQSFDLHHSFFKHDLRFQMMRQPHMVQLSWITTDKDCNIISQHDYIIQPKGFSIPPEATRIHGITTEIAKEKGAPIKEVIEKFMEDVYAANTLVGHNIAFDRRVINTELIRLRLNNEYDDTNYYDFDSKESICTMKESIQYCEIPSHNYYHPYKQPKLQELHKKLFGCEFEDAHNSMSDVTATLKCFKEMKKLGWI